MAAGVPAYRKGDATLGSTQESTFNFMAVIDAEKRSVSAGLVTLTTYEVNMLTSRSAEIQAICRGQLTQV